MAILSFKKVLEIFKFVFTGLRVRLSQNPLTHDFGKIKQIRKIINVPFAPLTKLSQMVRLTTKMDEPRLFWDRISHKNGTACSKFVLFYVYDYLHQFCFTIVLSCKNKIHMWIPT